MAGSGLARVLTGGGGHILALFIGCITTLILPVLQVGRR